MATLYHKGVRGQNTNPINLSSVMPYTNFKFVTSGATGTHASWLNNAWWFTHGSGVFQKPLYFPGAPPTYTSVGTIRTLDWTGERWEIGEGQFDDIDLTFIPGVNGGGPTLSYYQGPTDPDNPAGVYTATPGSNATGTVTVAAFPAGDWTNKMYFAAAMAVLEIMGVTDPTGGVMGAGAGAPREGCLLHITAYDPVTKWATTNGYPGFIAEGQATVTFYPPSGAGEGTPWEAGSFYRNYDPATGEVSNPSGTLPGENDIISFVGQPPWTSPNTATTVAGITNLLSAETMTAGDHALANITIKAGGSVEWEDWSISALDARLAAKCEISDCNVVSCFINSALLHGVNLNTSTIGTGAVFTGNSVVSNSALGDGVILRDNSAINGTVTCANGAVTYFFDHAYFAVDSTYSNPLGGIVWDSDSAYYNPANLTVQRIYMKNAVGQIVNSRQPCTVYVLAKDWTFPDPAGNITYDVSKLPASDNFQFQVKKVQ